MHLWRLKTGTVDPAVQLLDDPRMARSLRLRCLRLLGKLAGQLDFVSHGVPLGAERWRQEIVPSTAM
ncbi:hypothetical protein AS156_02050 [Bradyrhizobium macuxiense]|uniref:Uncharacterized protein n=1 Tax=Bradyrhizobium macuxiense TaxID=1755647 RepID=A0A109J9G7_9BRAD|nr:hypothetical protein AS156_02050 [Bradyrhizobium macuxiense]